MGSGYDTLLTTVARVHDDLGEPGVGDALRRAAVVIEEAFAVAKTAADFVANEEGAQLRLGERWYALTDALNAAGFVSTFEAVS